MKPEHKKTLEALTDWQLMGLCIEREASGEPYEGKVAVGTVILERVDHRNWDGKTIKEVILKPWQFSWTMPEAGEGYYNEAVNIATYWVDAFRERPVLQECCRIAIDMINGTIPRDPDLAAVNCTQYLNPKVAPEQKKKWLAGGMTTIKTISHHEFFKEG
jgi:hypothetical protein